MTSRSELPAILGGRPAFPGGPPDWPIRDPAIDDAVNAALADGTWGRYHGPHCERLSAALAEYHDTSHALLCSSGTVAVELALRAVKVRSGDEVILSAYDYKANFVNVLTMGAVPVLVDTLPGLPVIDPGRIAAAVGERTSAIIVSHLHGCLAEIDRIKVIAGESGIPVIEDACQATGALIGTRRAGSIGDVGVLSFGGSKLMTAGRGGAVLTDADAIAQRIHLYRFRGNDAYPLSELQAAVLHPQLKQLDERNARRLANAERFCNALPGSLLEPAVSAPRRSGSGQSDPGQTQAAFFKLGLRIAESSPLDRATLLTAAQAEGLALHEGFAALHRIHSARRFRAAGETTNADRLHGQLVQLHHPIFLQAPEEIDKAIACLRRIEANANRILEASVKS